MTCKHENADHLMPGEEFTSYTHGVRSPQPVLCEQFRCIDCGAWLSLGPANDDDERVRIEVRAAELAALADEDPERFKREHVPIVSDVGRGWWVHQMDLAAADEVTDRPEALAGYLARCIATHEETP